MNTSSEAEPLNHHVRPMRGRDPAEHHRTATSLEAFFDLTFATCFSLAAAQFAQTLSDGLYGPALLGMSLASFGICWAWINFSWFASAYDTDDWVFRLITMVQMIGVLVLAIGLPRMFASLRHGQKLDNSILVLGYVIMRLAMVVQWLRAARQDRVHRRACLAYAAAISIAQIGWVSMLFAGLSNTATIVAFCALALIEFAGPVIAERRDGGTPWHARHIVERNSLFALIALGEGVVGTAATLSAVIDAQGWSMDAALVCIAGTGLIFGMWWVYYLLPSAPFLQAHRERAFVWGYGQIVIVTAIVATGAGLHVAANFIEHQAHIGPLATVLCVAIPVAVFLAGIYALYYHLVRRFDGLHVWLLLGTACVGAAAVVAALADVDMAVCLLLLTGAPAVTVIGYEAWGYRYQEQALILDRK